MTRDIKRHPETTTLLSFAAGSLTEPLAAVIAAHISMCPQCRGEIGKMNRFGAALMEAHCDGDVARAIEVPARPSEPTGAMPVSVVAHDNFPPAITRKYGLGFNTIAWRRLGPGVWHHPLALSPGVVGDLRLLRIAAGCRMPEHGHGGAELTLVLDGAYADESGEFRCGDVQDVDDEIQHRPIADRHLGCICLIASEHPARFKSLVGRLMQPWTGM